jgi:uncharacterized membrane-anchored protein
MKTALVWVNALIILVAVNTFIVGKEQILADGQTMLLRLAPVDPRSLMQGDYMTLRYAIVRDIPRSQLKNTGHLVVRLDEHNVATFIRIHQGEPLNPGEHLLFYRNRRGPRLGAESFFFQEGEAERYENAEYGELKVDASGTAILHGLRDANFIPLDGKP